MSAAVESLLVEPVPRLVGHVAVPGDKSISHRSVLIGAICDGETRVTGFGRSADTEATIGAARALGIDVYEHGADTLRIFGKGLRGLQAPGQPIDCANAGTLVRLIAGILAGQDFQTFELTGDESLSRRPMGRIAEPLGRMGAGVETTEGHLPMGIMGRPLHAIDYTLPVASAQVKSAILLAGLYADGETTVVEPAPTRYPGTGLVFSEIAAATDPAFKIELQNLGATEVDLAGYRVVSSSRATATLAAQTVTPGGYVVLTAAELGFTPLAGDQLFLLQPGGTQFEDAQGVTNKLRGRAAGPWASSDRN